MKAAMNHSRTNLRTQGLALCVMIFVLLMSTPPMSGQAQISVTTPGGIAGPTATTSQIDIVGPPGSGGFGATVTALPNGNIVVTDPFYSISSPTPGSNVGAVYLYNGATGAMISMLTGSNESDEVGSGGVTVLANGNYVVNSPSWNDLMGAVTWGNSTTGINGVVSAANSLVGSNTFDEIGASGVTALTNGNYVVDSPFWNNGFVFVGAVTWGNGATGTSGVVSPANSLVGGLPSDEVGSSGVIPLTNGNYVVNSPLWSNGTIGLAGAVTWGNGATGTSGVVSPANSLAGNIPLDEIGAFGVIALTNGNYVVSSPFWDNGGILNAGAVTWANGATGISGGVTPANSLVGGTAFDFIGNKGVRALANGNYVVSSSIWDNGAIANAGAATWGNGTTGSHGAVSAANSLVGGSADDQVGLNGVTALTNGNYVVSSPNWDNGAIANAGAATWGNGATGSHGVVSVANSLVGSTQLDQVSSSGVTALANGNYVVSSQFWSNGPITAVGAATWGNGATGTSGAVSPANSLVGSSQTDAVGSSGATALANGNYVVRSPLWDNGAIANAGAATWGNGTTGTKGVVSVVNSLVGGSLNDNVSSFRVTALTNGNYVVSSPFWDNGGILNAGAVTWANGATGISGLISAANSLVGNVQGDGVGNNTVTALTNGNYMVRSPNWDNGAIVDAGAFTFGKSGGTVGPITMSNSVLGTVLNGGSSLVAAYDNVNHQLVVGRPLSNIVTLFRVITFDLCLQDDTNPSTSLTFSTQTGEYIFCAGGTSYSGTGQVTRRGSIYMLQHNASDRRVQASVDTSANRATASLQKLGTGGGIFSLADRDIRNNTCSCASH